MKFCIRFLIAFHRAPPFSVLTHLTYPKHMEDNRRRLIYTQIKYWVKPDIENRIKECQVSNCKQRFQTKSFEFMSDLQLDPEQLIS